MRKFVSFCSITTKHRLHGIRMNINPKCYSINGKSDVKNQISTAAGIMIANELLSGQVKDLNTHTLSRGYWRWCNSQFKWCEREE